MRRNLIDGLRNGEGAMKAEQLLLEALIAVCRQRPDVIVLDLAMPNIDGLAVLEACRHGAGRSVIPVILVSADSGLSHVAAELRGLGVRAYLSKPVDVDVLERLSDDLVRPAAAGAASASRTRLGLRPLAQQEVERPERQC
ncbi:MAG TPA: response regulator [Chloroflexota bacterium]|jgi:CheY-like chemotaxis protein|nr:response regulator [Chloroflexota bacterium]